MATHSISGSVFLDQSGDGSYQAGDVLQVGCTVSLLNSAGDTVATTTTLADGNYSFAGLANGRYSVAFTAPSGDQFSTPLSGNNGNGNGNEDGGGTQGSVAVTVANANVTGVNAGLYAPVSLSGTVFSDNNGNGLVDGTDKGLGGVTVQLLNAAGQPTGATTTTASNGSYSFTGLQPGTYSVQVDQVSSPAGALFSQLGSNTAPQPTGGTVTTQNNLLVNGNFNGLTTGGSYSLAQGLSGWTVSSNTPATPYGRGPGAGVELAVTNGSTAQAYQPGGGSNPYAGKASEDQANQNYYGGSTTDAAFFVDDGAVETLSQTVNLTAGQVYEVGFDLNQTLPGTGNPGFFQLSAALGGTVITTASSTSGVGSGTALPGGQWIHFADLYTATTSGPTTLTFTYASGTPGSSLASKDVLVDDVYIVPGQVTPTLTTTSQVNAAGITAPVTLTSGQSVGNESAGIYLPPATISGTVFLDANGDGALDGSEAGMAGRTVNLTANGTVIASAVTAANGSYSFGNLAAGSYTVTVVAPSGDKFSPVGSAVGGTDSSVGSGGTQTLTIASGATATVNAGIYAPSSVNGTVFNDLNGDGSKQIGEGGVSGATVQLVAANDSTVLATTTTAANGTYSFSNVAPGSDTVKVSAPSGEVFSPTGSSASLPNSLVASGGTDAVAIVSGSTNTINAGVFAPASISGTVFSDLNGNGVQQTGEPGLAGQIVQLLSGAAVVATATTAANGTYSFANVVPGNYTVSVTGAAGDVFSTPSTDAITLASGGSASFNAGEYAPSTVNGTVFADSNADGVQQSGEAGVSGATVKLMSGSTVLATTTTNASGTYSFINVAPGNDTLVVVAPNGDVFSPTGSSTALPDSNVASGGTDALAITPGSTSTVNAGVFAKGSLSGTVFTDANADGVQQSGEGGVFGQTVELLQGSTVVATTTTAANGSYSFGNINPGSYVVQAEAPSGTQFSTTTTTTLTSAQNAVVNVGEYRSASIGGSVFLDQNDNGVQDSGETNLAGVSVSLLNAAGQPVAGETTTTDQTGHYSFTGLNPGSYSVQIAAPTGDVFSPLGTAASPAIDNMANAQGVIGGITLVSGQNSAGNNAGVAATGELRSMVFFDGNNSGTYHVGDAGVAGVTVNLYDAHGIFVASAVTDSSGQYEFKNLAAGNYAVQVSAPSGTSFSAHEAASGNPLLDSDVNSSGSSGTLVVTSSNTTQGANAGLVFNGAFAGQTPAVLADGQQYASFTGGQVVVGAGDNNVHTGASGNNVVVLGGSSNVIELGFNNTTVQDIGVSAGAMQAQTQQAQNGFLFAGGNGASYLDGGAGNAYLMGGTGANQIYSGSGRTTIIAGGNGSLVTTGGISTAIAYQAGDGQLTIDNGLRTQDSLTVYGYSGGTIETVNSIQELVLSPNDVIAFSGATSFVDGATTGGNGLNFVASITAPPMEELSFVNELPVFTAQAAPAVPAGPAVLVSNIVTSNSGADLTLASTTTILNLSGYNNVVTGTNTGVSIVGDQGSSTFDLGNGNNQLVLSGYHDQIVLGDGNNTVSGNAGNTTITAGDGDNTITLGGYDNTITLGGGNNTLVAGQGNENIVAGAGNNTITADGYNNRITVAGGTSDIIAGRGNETVDVGSSTATVTLDGYANVVIGGQSHVIVSGGADNTYQINGFGDDGGMTINGFSMNNGDVLDLSTVMSHTDWNHEANTLSNYLSVSEYGNDTVISVSSGGASGHFATAATLQNIGPTSLGDLQAHHAISLF